MVAFRWSNSMTDEVCKQPQGKFIPVVDFSRCEAKGPCAEVCPYDIFEIRKIEPSEPLAETSVALQRDRLIVDVVALCDL
jgi:NAD-dependent dihydropyrimidine dehydrogenase PreA subunit